MSLQVVTIQRQSLPFCNLSTVTPLIGVSRQARPSFSKSEAVILEMLMENGPERVSEDAIMDRLGGDDDDCITCREFDTLVWLLRRKLQPMRLYVMHDDNGWCQLVSLRIN